MKIGARVAFSLSAFLLITAGIYWFTAYEPIGGSLLAIGAVGFAYIGLVSRSAARRAGRLDAPEQPAATEEKAEEEEHITPTIWPFMFSLAAMGIVLGVVVARWLLVVGGLLFAASAVGWFNDIRRQHAHMEKGGAHP
jgi:Cytochrome c oxidase subunit IV